MLMGALIGGVVGLAFYFIQQQQKKKQESATLDATVTKEEPVAEVESSEEETVS